MTQNIKEIANVLKSEKFWVKTVILNFTSVLYRRIFVFDDFFLAMKTKIRVFSLISLNKYKYNQGKNIIIKYWNLLLINHMVPCYSLESSEKSYFSIEKTSDSARVTANILRFGNCVV